MRSGGVGGASAILVLGAATSLTFSRLFSADHLPTYRDLLFFTWPIKQFLRERMLGGELPLWNPLLLMGTPFLGNLQSGVFYPPSLLLLLPLPLGFNLFLLIHYFVAVLGAWLWLRGRGLPVVPAAIGAAVFALGGYMVSLLNLTNHLQAAVWAPWVLHYWGRFTATGRTGDLLAFVATLCLELLGGSPENLLLTLVVLCGWTAYANRADWRQLGRLSAHLVLAGVATAGLCAVQILPTLEYVGESSRAGSLSFANVAHYSFQPVSGLQLILPHSAALLRQDAAGLGPSFEGSVSLIQSYYLGIVPLCLAIVGLAFGRERLLWGVVIVAGAILALGDHTPFFPLLYGAFPSVVGKFRYPEKFYFLVHLGAAAMAAEGARLVADRHPPSVRVALVATATLASVALVLCALRGLWPAEYLQSIAALRGRHLPLTAFVPLALDTYGKLQRLALILGALASVLLLGGRALRPATAAWLLLALSLVDLVSANRNLNQDMSWSELAARRPLIDTAEARERGERIYHAETIEVVPPGGATAEPHLTWWVPTIFPREDLDAQYRLLWETMNSDAGMLHGIANVSGSDGLTRASDDLLLRAMGEISPERAVKLLRIFGTGYLIGPGPLPSSAEASEVELGRQTPYRVLRVQQPFPLVHAVTRLRAERSPATALLVMSRDDFRPEREAVVETLPTPWSNEEPSPAAPDVTMLERSDDFWRFRVEGPARSFVVVNESFFPGWEATIDGAPAPILRANAIVRGVAVDGGSHVVEFAYRPKSVRRGAAISLMTALAITLGMAAASRRSRRSTPRVA